MFSVNLIKKLNCFIKFTFGYFAGATPVAFDFLLPKLSFEVSVLMAPKE